jgi:hypothetical protein
LKADRVRAEAAGVDGVVAAVAGEGQRVERLGVDDLDEVIESLDSAGTGGTCDRDDVIARCAGHGDGIDLPVGRGGAGEVEVDDVDADPLEVTESELIGSAAGVDVELLDATDVP